MHQLYLGNLIYPPDIPRYRWTGTWSEGLLDYVRHTQARRVLFFYLTVDLRHTFAHHQPHFDYGYPGALGAAGRPPVAFSMARDPART